MKYVVKKLHGYKVAMLHRGCGRTRGAYVTL